MAGGPAPYSLSPRRARRIASKSGRVIVKMIARRSERELKRCPFCEKTLEGLRTRDLFGEPTVAGRSCPACGLKIPPGRLGPARYVFELPSGPTRG